MAYWDGKKIIHRPTVPCKEHSGWDEIDCGCCGGIVWGGEEPEECPSCNGGGVIYQHRKSKVRAEYPGGRFC